MIVKRSSFQIIHAILSAIYDGFDKKTQIMYRACIDWRNCEKYLKFLIEREILSQNNGHFEIIEKGAKLHEHLSKALEIIGENENNYKK